ncbi:Os05g0119700, partial [Oryza sativa Japonica Group]
HEEEKGETKVEQEEVKTECTTQESNKIIEKQPHPDRKQETVSSKDELEPKEDTNTEHPNGTVSEDTSKVAMSPTKPQQQQKKNKPLLKKFGSLLKKKNSK